jgi:hypothetical protein
MARFRARENRIRRIVFIKGRKDDDLVARIAGGHHRHHHRFRAAAGDDEMLVGIDRKTREATDFPRQRRAEPGRAPSHVILVRRTAGRALESGDYFLRRIEVGKALREIDRAMLVGQPRRSADDGLGEN